MTGTDTFRIRNEIFRDLWMKKGCSEKLTIHVKSTGETIILINGLPVTLSQSETPLLSQDAKSKKGELIPTQPVTLTLVCEACTAQFQAQRKSSKYCSPRCRVSANRKMTEERKSRQVDEIMKKAFGSSDKNA